jgi:hypothetical protein
VHHGESRRLASSAAVSAARSWCVALNRDAAHAGEFAQPLRQQRVGNVAEGAQRDEVIASVTIGASGGLTFE